MESTNNYMETDLGNVSPNPKVTYDNATAYEYLDLVEYQGGSYLCIAALGTKITGTAPTPGKNTDVWQTVALPGNATKEYLDKHTEVIEKAKQVETSRAAVELCKQEVESAQADVEQMRQDTQQSAQSANDANTEAQQAAQQAEASRSAAQTSEQNAVASRNLANTYKTNAETAKSAAETAAQNASESKTAAETAAQNAAQSKADIESIKAGIEEAAKGENVLQIQKNMSDIGQLKESKITKFYASNQGETHLADSDNGKIMDMMLYGKSEQFTATGKNLLKIRDSTQTTRGVTVTAKDGVVALKGTATETGWALIDVDPFVLDGTCILSTNITGVAVVLANKSFKAVLNQNNSNTLENEEASKVCFTVTEGKTYDISNILVQIEKGSKATSYEPYVGGHPSPSPDYPQEIKSVVNPKVKVCGKNLWNPILKGYINNTNGSITATPKASVAVTDFIKKSGKDITVIARNFSSAMEDSYAYRIGLYDVRKKWIKNIIPSNGNKCSVNTFNVIGTEYIRVSAPSGIYDTIQIEKGSEATSYEPYTDQSVQLPYTLNAIPVSSGGNVTIDGQQYIADYVDVERGKIVQMVQRGKIMDISNVSIISNGFDEYVFVYANSKKFIQNIVGITNIANFNDISGSNNNASRGIFAVSWDRIYLRISKMALPQTLEGMKKWLNNNDLYFILPLTSPIEIDLHPEEITAFKALASYYPTTNISVNSEQLDGYTVFNYPISMANGWNYVKQQLNDNRNYIYDMDLQSAEAYVNSEYAVALTELEVI